MLRAALEGLLFGILEGITEWLPVSSTGHLILLRRFLSPSFDDAFFSLFEVVIQLGAILAVVCLFFGELWPLSRKAEGGERKKILALWGKILIATAPAALIGFFFEDILDFFFYNPISVAITLVLYGIVFLILEKIARKTEVNDLESIKIKDALCIGLFQCLSLIPGTSRSGSTMIGGRLLGLSRSTAASLSFFLAIPTMAGAGLLRALRFLSAGEALSAPEGVALALGTVTAFAVSLISLRFLMDFVRRHSFAPFGIYRIVLGVAVLLSLLF